MQVTTTTGGGGGNGEEEARTRERRRRRRAEERRRRRELGMTCTLLATAVSHAVLTIPGSIGFLLYTNFPELWDDFEGR